MLLVQVRLVWGHMNIRFSIIAMFVAFVCIALYKGRFPDPKQQALWYGYIWNLPYDCYYRENAEACKKYREPDTYKGAPTSPWYKGTPAPLISYSVRFGPVNVFHNGEWQQEWQWITVPKSKH